MSIKNHISHGPCRRWRTLWRTVCRCGIAAWPCPTRYVAVPPRRSEPRTTRPAEDQPTWDGPTRNLMQVPLLTRGQAMRSRQGQRW